MKKFKTALILIMLIIFLVIDYQIFFGQNALSWLTKWLIVGIISIGEGVSIATILMMTSNDVGRKREFGIAEKLHSILVILSTIIYTIGVWASTPSIGTHYVKEIFLGLGLLVQFVFLLFFVFKKTKEKPDERFISNLAKTATIMFVISLIVLFTLAMVLALTGSITVFSGYLFVLVGLLVLLFAAIFFFFEKWG
ncbi:hypothetical protein [Streptococcus zalophi]|uniref:DUF3796 domain-containing protein n=1 Tax=Streptococcus zalophi TaxID=640031 RepID=A0A934UDR9_9STRE|nr:hypothetical protein [Streptococcus zalophi]MBJ8350101.1 hypothetical protein [Streptococcus zalophi]